MLRCVQQRVTQFPPDSVMFLDVPQHKSYTYAISDRRRYNFSRKVPVLATLAAREFLDS